MVIDSEIWQPPQWFYAFIVCSCIAAIAGRIHFIYKRSRITSPNLESSVNSFMNLPSSFLSFQRSFLSVYFLACVAEGLQAVYGESLYQQYGLGREDMALLLASGYLTSLFFGTFLGCLSDFLGRKKACIVFCILHLVGSLAKQFSKYYSIWMGTASIAIASLLFSCCFETWMTAEHEKLGFRQEWLSDTFWTMSFGGAASSLGSSALANALVKWKTHHGMTLPLVAAAIVAVICAILISRGWGENRATFRVKIPSTVLLFPHLMAG